MNEPLDEDDVLEVVDLQALDNIIQRLEDKLADHNKYFQQLQKWKQVKATLFPNIVQAEEDALDEKDDAEEAASRASFRNDATDPIGKRRSPNEAVTKRIERIILFLNQVGKAQFSSIWGAIQQSDGTARYAMRRGGVFTAGNNSYAAGRISTLWDGQDAAMFGLPKVVDRHYSDDEALPWQQCEEKIEEPAAPELLPRPHPHIAKPPAVKPPAVKQPEEPDDAPADAPPIPTKTEEWLKAGDHPEYETCDLCDSPFSQFEDICVAVDFHGKKVMCKPCARRANHSPPKTKPRF